MQTDATDGTYAVGNDEFLLAVFGSEIADARPMVVSFSGDPTKVLAKAWFGRPWQADPPAPTRSKEMTWKSLSNAGAT